MNQNIIPSISESELSRRALGVLNSMGFNADDLITKCPNKYRTYIKIPNCGPSTARELSRVVNKYLIKQRRYEALKNCGLAFTITE